MSELFVTDVPDSSRFEARRDGVLVGWLEYTNAGKRVVLSHTEVPTQFEGTGVASGLVRSVLDTIAAGDPPQEVVPVCPFVAQWLLRHTDYAPLVTPALRSQFEPR